MGLIPILVRAVSLHAGDAIEVILLVKVRATKIYISSFLFFRYKQFSNIYFIVTSKYKCFNFKFHDTIKLIKVRFHFKPEGQPQSYSVSELIQLNSTHNFSSSFEIELPNKDVLVEGSVRMEVSVVGEILGKQLFFERFYKNIM